MQANTLLSLTEWLSTLKSHSSQRGVGFWEITWRFNVTPEGTAQSTGGALLRRPLTGVKCSCGSGVLSESGRLSVPRSE